MPLPHPKPRKDQDRNEDKPKVVTVWENFLRRTIDIAKNRKAKEDVNPAKNCTFGALVHKVVMGDLVMTTAVLPTTDPKLAASLG